MTNTRAATDQVGGTRVNLRASSLQSGEVPLTDVREGFTSSFVLEMIDTARQQQRIETYVFVLNPTQYNLSEPFAKALTPTEDDTVVAEENGIILREITIEGTTALKARAATGFLGSQGGGKSLTGNQHFRALRDFFRRYSDLKKDPERSHHVQMIFHSLRDDDHFVVVPDRFETPRDARSTRVHFNYRITLQVIGESDRNAPTLSSPGGFDLNNALRDVAQFYADARGAFATATKGLSAIQRYVGNINAIMGQTAGLINQVGKTVSGAQSLINAPLTQFAAGFDQLAAAGDSLADQTASIVQAVRTEDASILFEDSIRAITRIEQAGNRIAAYPERFLAPTNEDVATAFGGPLRATNRDAREGTAGADAGLREEVAFGSARDAGLDLSGFVGSRRIPVDGSDTIESIATEYGVDPEVLVVINDLQPPFITRGGGPGVLAPGDTMLVPLRVGGPGTGARRGGTGYATPDDLLFGVDIAIDVAKFDRTGKFDLLVDEVHDAQDAQLVRGVENVVQGTRISVESEYGATTHVPEIGVKRSVGTRGTIPHMLMASIRLREAMVQDPRIEGIESFTVVLDGDVLTQEISPRIVGRAAGPLFTVPFGTAAGEGA